MAVSVAGFRIAFNERIGGDGFRPRIAFIEKGAKCDCHFRLGSRHNLIRNTDGLIVKGAGSEVGMKRNGGPYEVDVIRRIGIDRGVGYVRIPQTGGLKRYKPI